MTLALVVAVDDVVSFGEPVDQAHDLAGRILEVVVDDRHAVAGYVVKPAHDGVVLAKVARQADVLDDSGMAPLGLSGAPIRAVPAAVVDDHDLELGNLRPKLRHHLVDEVAEGLLAVVGRDEDAKTPPGPPFRRRRGPCRHGRITHGWWTCIGGDETGASAWAAWRSRRVCHRVPTSPG